ncbi:MAG: hypothetical protein J1E03_05600 [Acetatifactor sp.]|nr:hypothetical protein [Acetatifactor sp.]
MKKCVGKYVGKYVGVWMAVLLAGASLLGSCGLSEEGENTPVNTQEDLDSPEGSAQQEAKVTEVPIGVEIQVNLSREGVTEDTVRIYQGVAEEEYETMVPVCVEVNGQVLETEERFEWLISCYLIRQSSRKTYLIFDTDYMSADYVTHLYELTDGEFRRASEPVGGACIETVNTDSVLLRETVNVLGTYWPKMQYSISETGELTRQEGLYYTEAFESQIMTVMRELPVLLDGQETTLPVGTRLRITATDNEGIAWFCTETDGQDLSGVEGEIHYTRQDYEIMIDGVSEYEYFDMVPYSG